MKCRSIWRARRFQNCSWEGQKKANFSRAPSEDTWQRGNKLTTASRSYKIDILGHSCDVVKHWCPLEIALRHLFWIFFNFQKLSQIIANLFRENLTEREAEITSFFFDTDGERQCTELDIVSDVPKNLCSSCCHWWRRSHLGKRRGIRKKAFVSIGVRFSKSASRGDPKHHQYENILKYIQKALVNIRWVIDRTEFDELIAMKKDSAPGLDGNPYGVFWCAGSLGSQFLFNACNHVVKGGVVLEHFAESRTVFISKDSDIDDNGRIIRSPDALRPLTLCNCNCKLLIFAVNCKLLIYAICRGLHWNTMRCIHSSQRGISLRQITDNIFEIETTALAHVACAPQESGVLLTDFAAAYPSVKHSWIFSVLANTGLPGFLCRFLRNIYGDTITHVEFAGAKQRQFFLSRGVRQGLLSSGFPLAMAFGPIFRWLQE